MQRTAEAEAGVIAVELHACLYPCRHACMRGHVPRAGLCVSVEYRARNMRGPGRLGLGVLGRHVHAGGDAGRSVRGTRNARWSGEARSRLCSCLRGTALSRTAPTSRHPPLPPRPRHSAAGSLETCARPAEAARRGLRSGRHRLSLQWRSRQRLWRWRWVCREGEPSHRRHGSQERRSQRRWWA